MPSKLYKSAANPNSEAGKKKDYKVVAGDVKFKNKQARKKAEAQSSVSERAKRMKAYQNAKKIMEANEGMTPERDAKLRKQYRL